MKATGHHIPLLPPVLSHLTTNSYFTPFLPKICFNIIISASDSHALSHTVQQVGVAEPGSNLV